MSETRTDRIQQARGCLQSDCARELSDLLTNAYSDCAIFWSDDEVELGFDPEQFPNGLTVCRTTIRIS